MQSTGPAASDSFDAFATLQRQPPDALLALIAMHRNDPRPHKIDLGVGVYRNDAGETPVPRSIKEAERRLQAGQPSKAYLGAEGDQLFTDLLAEVALGPVLARQDRITGVQTPGGTGALRLAAELIARARPGARVWIGAPSWPNHAPIMREAGLAVQEHPIVASTGEADMPAITQALRSASAGDVVLLQACCHNPTGIGLTVEQWDEVAALLVQRRLLPLLDLAYQGLGDGLEADAAGVRRVVSVCPEALLAYSCDKNFALYRDRVGALWVSGSAASTVPAVRDNLLVLARCLWSMPPDHGAAAARIVLEDPALRGDWLAELEEMRARLNALRSALAALHPRLAPLANQRGMFAMLPITPADVARLREERGIYMAANGRINIAGLHAGNLDAFAQAIVPLLGR